jgi:hypothetical protein
MRIMTRLLVALLALALPLATACGQTAGGAVNALIVASCGTPPGTYSVGQIKAVLQDTTGKVCTSGSGGGGGGGGNVNLNQVGGAFYALGPALMTASMPVTIASNQSILSVVNTNVEGTVGAGGAASKSLLIGGQFNSAAPTLTNGQQAAIQFDSAGNLKVNIQAGASASSNIAQWGGVNTSLGQTVMSSSVPVVIASNQSAVSVANSNIEGTVAAGAAATKSALVGGVFNTVAPTLTNGQQAAAQFDSSGNLKVNIQAGAAASSNLTQLAGNSIAVGGGAITNGTQRHIPASIVTVKTTSLAASLVACASACNLYGVSMTTATVSGYMMLFDATSAPADGAVTPLECVPVLSNGTNGNLGYTPAGTGINLSTGLVVVFSTTGCFTKTSSSTAFIAVRAI